MADNKLIRPPKTNLFFGSEGVKEDFKDESNTIPNSKDEILNFTNSQIYKTGLAYYSRWENGLVLDTFNTSTYIDSHRTAYLYQQGIAEFDKTQNYFHGSLFLIGSVPHVVIGSDLSYTTKVDFSTTPDFVPYVDSSSSDLFTQSLDNSFADFRTKCLPLHLYQEGLTRPVISGLNLVDKYPTFFTNSDGGAVTTYNNGRQKFIDVNLPFLKSGTTYKSFNVPQGFGLVNNQSNIGTTTGGGDGADINNHLVNHVCSFIPIQLNVEGIHQFDLRIGCNNDSWTNDPTKQFPRAGYKILSQRHGAFFFLGGGGGGTPGSVANVWENTDPEGLFTTISVDAQATYMNGYGLEKSRDVTDPNDTNKIDKAWFDLHPNTGAGLQLGYYTLLKQL